MESERTCCRLEPWTSLASDAALLPCCLLSCHTDREISGLETRLHRYVWESTCLGYSADGERWRLCDLSHHRSDQTEPNQTKPNQLQLPSAGTT